MTCYQLDIPNIHLKGIQLAEESFAQVYDLKVNSTGMLTTNNMLDVRRLGKYIAKKITPSSIAQ